MAESKKGIGISLAILLSVIFVLLLLRFDATHGLDSHYVDIFTGLGIVDALALTVFLLWGAIMHDDEETFAPRAYDDNEDRPLSQFGIVKIIAIVLLVFFFAGAEVATSHSIIPIINPYNSAQLISSKEQFSVVGNGVLNAVRTGLYAGVFEDIGGYALTTIFALFFLWLFKRFDEDAFSRKLYIGLSLVLGSFAWAIIFATAHEAVYGINTQAYIAAFSYGFASQVINGFVGAPVSIFAHFSHNFLAVWFFGVAVSIGGVPLINGTKNAALLIIPTSRRFSMKKTTLIIAMLAILALFLTACSTVQQLNIGSSTCGANNADYANAPNNPHCNSDADCLSTLVPAGHQLDPGTSLRCSNNICQFKITTCTGSVNP